MSPKVERRGTAFQGCACTHLPVGVKGQHTSVLQKNTPKVPKSITRGSMKQEVKKTIETTEGDTEGCPPWFPHLLAPGSTGLLA